MDEDNADAPGSHGDPRSNVELYRELKTHLPSALLDHYNRDGIWKRDVLLLDLELIQVHRREAGAPDPGPLSDAIVAELKSLEDSEKRKVRNAPVGGRASMPQPTLRPKPNEPSAPSSASARPDDEAQMMADFIEKFQLQPTRAKLLLQRLTPRQRQAVMTNFDLKDSSQASTSQLDAYIKDSARTGFSAAPIGSRSRSSDADGGTRDRSRTPPRATAQREPPLPAASAPSSVVPTWRVEPKKPPPPKPSVTPSVKLEGTASKAGAPTRGTALLTPTSSSVASSNGGTSSKARGALPEVAIAKPRPTQPKAAAKAKAPGSEIIPGGLISALLDGLC